MYRGLVKKRPIESYMKEKTETFFNSKFKIEIMVYKIIRLK